MKDKEQFLDGVLVSTMKLEAEKTWRIRELERFIDKMGTYFKSFADDSVRPDEWIMEEWVRRCESILHPSPTPPAPAATSDEEIWVGSREWHAREELRKANEAAEKIKGLVPPVATSDEREQVKCVHCGYGIGQPQLCDYWYHTEGPDKMRAYCYAGGEHNKYFPAEPSVVAPPAVGETAQTAKGEIPKLLVNAITELNAIYDSTIEHDHGIAVLAERAINHIKAWTAATAIYQKALGEKEAELAAEKETVKVFCDIHDKELKAAEAELAVVRKALELQILGGGIMRTDLLNKLVESAEAAARAALESGEGR